MSSWQETSIEVGSQTFGKLVHANREDRNWSQGDLAARWGFTRA